MGSRILCVFPFWIAALVQGFSVETGNSRIFVGTPSSPRKSFVVDYMTTSPVLLKPQMSVDDAMELFLRHNINGAAVVDDETENGETVLVGILSSFDFLQKEAFEGSLLPMEGSVETVERYVHAAQRICGQTVADIMTHIDSLQTITSDTPMRQAAVIMSQHKLHRLPVVAKKDDNDDKSGPTLVGMLTAEHVMQDLVHIVRNLPPAHNEDNANTEKEEQETATTLSP